MFRAAKESQKSGRTLLRKRSSPLVPFEGVIRPSAGRILSRVRIKLQGMKRRCKRRRGCRHRERRIERGSVRRSEKDGRKRGETRRDEIPREMERDSDRDYIHFFSSDGVYSILSTNDSFIQFVSVQNGK